MNKYNLDDIEMQILNDVMKVVDLNDCRKNYDLLDFWGSNTEITLSLMLYGDNQKYEHIASIKKDENYKRELKAFCKKCNLCMTDADCDNDNFILW